ncbi:hypothetical protein BVI2075_80042 [Burkholderia vietnamiensis]|nr:hypothetical protein BVI2075_80042 [Burkholderia vietnamiensis]
MWFGPPDFNFVLFGQHGDRHAVRQIGFMPTECVVRSKGFWRGSPRYMGARVCRWSGHV